MCSIYIFALYFYFNSASSSPKRPSSDRLDKPRALDQNVRESESATLPKRKINGRNDILKCKLHQFTLTGLLISNVKHVIFHIQIHTCKALMINYKHIGLCLFLVMPPERITETEFTVKWDFISPNKTSIEGFKISYERTKDQNRNDLKRSDSKIKMIKTGPSATEMVLRNLQPSTEYSIKVQVYDKFKKLAEREKQVYAKTLNKNGK